MEMRPIEDEAHQGAEKQGEFADSASGPCHHADEAKMIIRSASDVGGSRTDSGNENAKQNMAARPTAVNHKNANDLANQDGNNSNSLSSSYFSNDGCQHTPNLEGLKEVDSAKLDEHKSKTRHRNLEKQHESSVVGPKEEEQAHTLLYLKNQGNGFLSTGAETVNTQPNRQSKATEYLKEVQPPTESPTEYHQKYPQKLTNAVATTVAKIEATSSVISPTKEHAQILLLLRNEKKKNLPPGRTRVYQKLSQSITDYLTNWVDEHIAHPYPSEREKVDLMTATGLSKDQLNNWFGSERKRRRKAAGFKPTNRSYTKRSILAVSHLEAWYDEHSAHPYPSKEEKTALGLLTNMTEQQINDWFGRERVKRKKAAGGTTEPREKLPKASVDYLKKWIAENDPVRPTKVVRAQMVADTGLTEKQIRQFFMNHRARKKRNEQSP